MGQRIREKRKGIGISQEALARRADVSLNLINRVERGETRDPHYSTLVSIAHALDTTVAELTGEMAAPLAQAPSRDTLSVSREQWLAMSWTLAGEEVVNSSLLYAAKNALAYAELEDPLPEGADIVRSLLRGAIDRAEEWQAAVKKEWGEE